MSIIITCGFESVDLSTFRPQSLKKGLKLLESKHVSKVSEQSDPNCNSKLQGTVLRQTPGAFSSKKNIKFYKPFVEVIFYNFALYINFLYVRCIIVFGCFYFCYND